MARTSESRQLGQLAPKMTILSDRPCELFSDDLLGLESRLSAVLDILRHRLTKCPITIAIYGDWGTGKTSAMCWLKGQLESWNTLSPAQRQDEKGKGHPCVYPVWFDPWKYHSRQDVWRGIISEVILSLFDTKNLSRQDFVPRMKEAAKKFGAFLGKGFLHALAGIELKLKADTVAAGAEISVKGEMFREIYEEFDKATHPEKAYLNYFEDTLKSWVASFLREEGRIALFIDDLDRCLPEVTLEVLEAIKLYLNIPQLMFVVGLDRAVVDGVVIKHYDDHGLGKEKAEKYLDKIFQVEVQISPSQTQMTDFHTRQIAHLDASTGGYWRTNLADDHRTILEEGISELSRGNPRELKRLLNSALLRGRAATDNAVLRKQAPPPLLFAQGVQFFLVQKIVERWFGRSSNLLLKTPILGWFQLWSALLKDTPSYRPVKQKGVSQAQGTKTEEVLRVKFYEDQGIGYQKLQERDERFESLNKSLLVHDDGKSIDKQLLLDDELLWKLLRIPFSVEVAESVPSLEMPTAAAAVASAPQPKEVTRQPSAVPDLIRGRISKDLNKPVDQLTEADVAAVKKLDLSSSDIVETDLSYLDKLTTLRWLGLNDTKITDVGLTSLEKLTELENLFLAGTQITDAGLRSLEKLTALQGLELKGTQITDVGLRSLEKLSRLWYLSLLSTQITDAGLKSLEGLTMLHFLFLGGTQITDVGLKSLEELPKLCWLNLARTQITDAGLKSLEGLTELQWLLVGETQIAGSGFESLEKLKSLEYLYLMDTPITDGELKSVEKLTLLSHLSLGGTAITDAGLRFLEKLTKLTDLDLRGTQISDAGLKSLEKLTALTKLDLRGAQISDAGLKSLEKLTALESLSLHSTQITDAGFKTLQTRLPRTAIHK